MEISALKNSYDVLATTDLTWSEWTESGEIVVCSQKHDSVSRTTVVTKHGPKHSCLVTYRSNRMTSVDRY